MEETTIIALNMKEFVRKLEILVKDGWKRSGDPVIHGTAIKMKMYRENQERCPLRIGDIKSFF